jgi:hypothetical protein
MVDELVFSNTPLTSLTLEAPLTDWTGNSKEMSQEQAKSITEGKPKTPGKASGITVGVPVIKEVKTKTQNS